MRRIEKGCRLKSLKFTANTVRRATVGHQGVMVHPVTDELRRTAGFSAETCRDLSQNLWAISGEREFKCATFAVLRIFRYSQSTIMFVCFFFRLSCI